MRVPVSSSKTWNCKEGVCQNTGGNAIFLYLEKYSDGSDESLASLRAELQASPATVVYELATPVYEVLSADDDLYIDSYAEGHLDFTSAVPIEQVVFKSSIQPALKYVKSNTNYLIQFESDNVGKIDLVHLAGTNLSTGIDVVKGINKINITTGESVGFGYLDIYGIGANISNLVVTEATDKEFGYFKGMKSVGECEELEVKTTNENIIDITKLDLFPYSGQEKYSTFEYLDDGGLKVHSTIAWGRVQSKVIDVSNLDCLYVKYDLDESTTGYRTIGVYNAEDGVRLQVDFSYSGSNDNARYDLTGYDKIYFLIYGSGDVVDTFVIYRNVMFSDKPITSYIPPQFSSQQLTHEPLRAVGDAKDRYVLIDGEWYIERNCSEIVLDGSESWFSFDQAVSPNNPRACIVLENAYIKVETNYGVGVCDKCDVCSLLGDGDRDYHHIKIANSSVLGYPVLWVYMPNVDTLQQFKGNLQVNPYTVIYQLATPVYEKIDYNPLSVYTDLTHITTNSTIPCNMTIKNHGFNALLRPSINSQTTYTIASNQGIKTLTTKKGEVFSKKSFAMRDGSKYRWSVMAQ